MYVITMLMMPIYPEKKTKNTITGHTERPRPEAAEREAGTGATIEAESICQPALVGIGAPASKSVFERLVQRCAVSPMMMMFINIRWRLKLEGETENMGVCTKERKGVTAEVLMTVHELP